GFTTLVRRSRGTFHSQSTTSSCGSRYGNGSSRTAFTIEKTPTVAPSPSAQVSTHTVENPGFLRTARPACRRSRRSRSTAARRSRPAHHAVQGEARGLPRIPRRRRTPVGGPPLRPFAVEVGEDGVTRGPG